MTAEHATEPCEHAVKFTQYLLPDGRKTAIEIHRPAEIATQAKRLVEHGCRLEIEMLRTGDISMTVERDPITDEDDGVLAHEVCANGPAVPVCVDKLITNSSAALFATP